MTIRLDHRRNISVHLEISRSSVRSSEIPPLVTGDPATDRYCQDLRLSRLVYNLSSLKRTTLCRARIYVHCQASGLAPTGIRRRRFLSCTWLGVREVRKGKQAHDHGVWEKPSQSAGNILPVTPGLAGFWRSSSVANPASYQVDPACLRRPQPIIPPRGRGSRAGWPDLGAAAGQGQDLRYCRWGCRCARCAADANAKGPTDVTLARQNPADLSASRSPRPPSWLAVASESPRGLGTLGCAICWGWECLIFPRSWLGRSNLQKPSC